jgi:hypothetical protein
MILYHWLRTGSFHSSPLISDENSENPLTPLHRLSTASLSGVVRCVAIATLIFRYFLRYFSSTSTEQIFPDSAGPFIVSIVFGFAIFAKDGLLYRHSRRQHFQDTPLAIFGAPPGEF